MNFGSKLFPLECTQAKKLTDGRLGRPHVRRATDIPVSLQLTLSNLVLGGGGGFFFFFWGGGGGVAGGGRLE